MKIKVVYLNYFFFVRVKNVSFVMRFVKKFSFMYYYLRFMYFFGFNGMYIIYK